MVPTNNYELLITKLDEFIRKYYINSAIRGLLYCTGLILLLFLVVSLLESQFYFSGGTRKLLWYGFLLLSGTALAIGVGLPLARYFRLGSTISHERAAQIIGAHFSNVQDKLLNVLQLRRQADREQDALLLASIDQKSSEISPVPFRSAIDLTQNSRYLKYALPPLLLLLVLLVAAPSLIRDSTSRLIRNSEHFDRPAPFRFVLSETNPQVIQYGSYPLTVRAVGDVVPAEAFIEVDGYRYRLIREDGNTFSYAFNNVQEDTPFRISAGEVSTPEYLLSVMPKPTIAGFSVALDYPAYLGRQDEVTTNIGDLTVPAGTRLKWSFDTENTESIGLRFAAEDSTAELRRDGRDLYSFEKRALRSDRYSLYIGNEYLPLADSITYTLAVIPDQYPRISVESFQDSTDEQLLFFVGEASDDYGLTQLDFVYRIQPAEGEAREGRQPITTPSNRQIRYDHVLDLRSDLPLEAGDALTYYFEVYDNDAVNGRKSAKTAVMSYRVPTREEMDARAEANDSKVKEQLQQALKATRELQDETKKVRDKMLQEKEVDWKLRKEVEKLAERQEEIQRQIEEARQAFEENLENQPQENEQIRQKEQKLQEMFEKSVSQELQELMQEIQRLMEELNKDATLEKMEDIEMSDEEAEAELDRMLELFKQLEVEKEMQDAIEQLEELAEEQEELARQNAEGEKTPEELQREQEALREQFEKLQEKLEQAEQKNEALERPMNLDTKQKQQEAVKQDMQEAEKQLQEQQENQEQQQGEQPQEQSEAGEQEQQEGEQPQQQQQQQNQQQKPQNGAQKQQDAAKKMQQMAQQMQESMESMQMESNREDMAAIRQLLENLVDLSFDQEETMDQLNLTTVNTPRYVELVQQQFQINNDFELVRDSLQALAKRNFQIESFITEKVTEIRSNLSGTVDELEERRMPQAANLQQRAMTGLNDLALMLSESMEQMQQQMAGQMKGQQQCQNPRDGQQGQQTGQPSENPGSDGQKEVGEQLRELKEGLEKGEGGSSKEFAEMAARQAALRRALEEKQRERQQNGQGKDGELEHLIEQMNAAEEDMVNKRLTNETLMRQQDILTRMLEHERAEREQKLDEKRKSETAEQQRRELPPSLEDYIRQRRAEVEQFKRVTPELKPYYQGLVDEYFRSLSTSPL
ncbi:hypothetical protein GGR26_003584 [Lewinella marina]|uniref:DUF4175 domain-containing protein n=1 Tax=Neolewinella marina TaxID=438751 RepID=A0A2G0CBA7_9BACT|nr:DUF4175 family protein [Neolewinella marina]NJB87798.1 hypothetical protein [Neolewinella marina]PHK97268.1 DUF4175 domain-containing protein [Neolewinella marina]